MSSNSISIAKEVREELEHLIQSVMGEESQTADRVERDLWRGMLRLAVCRRSK
jgi:hypothetical protein